MKQEPQTVLLSVHTNTKKDKPTLTKQTHEKQNKTKMPEKSQTNTSTRRQ
jgi:hypothetical protein